MVKTHRRQRSLPLHTRRPILADSIKVQTEHVTDKLKLHTNSYTNGARS